jgi:hypothetical protein
MATIRYLFAAILLAARAAAPAAEPGVLPPVGKLQSGAAAAAVSVAPSAPRLDRNKLLVFRNARGEPLPVQSAADWQQRRAAVLAAMQQVMGDLPGNEKRCPLDVKTAEETDCGSYVRRLISYAAEPGGRVPAYLLIPKKALSRAVQTPAILCLHPTDNKLGHKVVVGLGGKPRRDYARELAERGFIALAPSYPLLADYQPDLKSLGYASGTMKAIWDNIRGLDVLDSLPQVKPGGFGAIGHSLGGHNAVFTAVFDQRIKVIVSSCGLDSFLDYMGGDAKCWQPERNWCQTRYMPRLAAYAGRLEDIPFDFHELVGALAPRTCLLSAPLKDDNFRWQSVDRIAAAARPVYELLGQPQALIVAHPDCAHDFPDEMREKAYRLFEERLCGGASAAPPREAVEAAVQRAHAELWRRFVDEHNILLDYTALDGRILRPTPQDCREHKPSALSWGVPIEDGPMFNGLYLDAMCNRWKHTRDEADRARARRLVEGLLLLASLGKTPGFIARGVATDGKTTYPMGSIAEVRR